MNLEPQQVRESTAGKLAARLGDLHLISAVVGLDGFVDEIVSVVNKRLDGDRFEPVRTIEAFGRRVAGAANQSTNIELVTRQTKLGGNGPIMADALAAAGMGVTCIGSLGYPEIHPVFAELSRRATVCSIAPAGRTTAMEFEDGKLMLNQLAGLGEVNWENLLQRVGRERLMEMAEGARLIGLLNWTMLPGMMGIWKGFLEEIFPKLSVGPRTLFVDLADPQKRTAEDLSGAIQMLGRMAGKIELVLGMNLKESVAVAAVMGISDGGEEKIEQRATKIRERLGAKCVVIHPRSCAAAATEGKSARFEGPFVKQPTISTGAGDHFNAGFCLGWVLGMELEECLCLGVASSGFYVRSGRSAGGAELVEFVRNIPASEK